jgi:hypothetical protein
MADAGGQQLFDMWKKQVEEGSQAWLRMLSTPQAAPMDPQAFWRPFMTQGQAPPDLMAQWKQFLDQWIAAWSKVLEQAMGTEAFAKTLGKQMEGFLNTAGPAKKAVDQQVEVSLAGLGLASRSQLIAVAQQIIQLEEKIEGVEDKLDAVLRRLDAVGGPR